MADTAVSSFNALAGSGMAAGDLVPIIDVSGSGAAKNCKATLEELAVGLRFVGGLGSVASRALHVDAAGNNTTGDGSAGAPYATVQKAFDVARTLTPTTASPVLIRARGKLGHNVTLDAAATAATLGQSRALLVVGDSPFVAALGTLTISGAAYLTLADVGLTTITHATASGALRIDGSAAAIGTLTSRQNNVTIEGGVFVESVILSPSAAGEAGEAKFRRNGDRLDMFHVNFLIHCGANSNKPATTILTV